MVEQDYFELSSVECKTMLVRIEAWFYIAGRSHSRSRSPRRPSASRSRHRSRYGLCRKAYYDYYWAMQFGKPDYVYMWRSKNRTTIVLLAINIATYSIESIMLTGHTLLCQESVGIILYHLVEGMLMTAQDRREPLHKSAKEDGMAGHTLPIMTMDTIREMKMGRKFIHSFPLGYIIIFGLRPSC